MAWLGEEFQTYVTWKWLLPWMSSYVCFKTAWYIQRLWTFLTNDLRISPTTQYEFACVSFFTNKWFLPWMISKVCFTFIGWSKWLRKFFTNKWLLEWWHLGRIISLKKNSVWKTRLLHFIISDLLITFLARTITLKKISVGKKNFFDETKTFIISDLPITSLGRTITLKKNSTWQKLRTSVAVTVSVTCLCWFLEHAEQLLFWCLCSEVSICNYVTCHILHVTCHIAHVTCHI